MTLSARAGCNTNLVKTEIKNMDFYNIELRRFAAEVDNFTQILPNRPKSILFKIV